MSSCKYKYVGEEDGKGDIHPGDIKELGITVFFDGDNGGVITRCYPSFLAATKDWEEKNETRSEDEETKGDKMITKEQFIKLAEACVNQDRYERELFEHIKTTAKKHKQDTDFLGLPIMCDRLFTAACDILGEDFSYYLYDCKGNFKTFNKNITFNDGTHPKVKSLGDLYDFAVAEESIK